MGDVLDGDLLTEEGSPDGQVPLQLQQDQCLQEVQLYRQANSMEDTEVMGQLSQYLESMSGGFCKLNRHFTS